MVTWGEFARSNPELAAFGHERLHDKVAFLATVRGDCSPRVHPVTPIIAGGNLYIFMEPASPKGHDLRRKGRYALHSWVSDTSGRSGEFSTRGRATPVDDPETRALAAAASNSPPLDRYVLFQFSIEGAFSTTYERGQPVRTRWGRF